MRFAILSGQVVVNTIEAAEGQAPAGAIPSETAGIGDTYANGVFSRPAIPVSVPQEVTMRQARQALILAGLDETVEALLAAIPGQAGKLARAEWERSQTVQRTRPLVLQMAAALGMTSQQLDQLFITAGSL